MRGWVQEQWEAGNRCAAAAWSVHRDRYAACAVLGGSGCSCCQYRGVCSACSIIDAAAAACDGIVEGGEGGGRCKC